ncbi:hypothetical protein PGB90_000964 [Kerria lacca]
MDSIGITETSAPVSRSKEIEFSLKKELSKEIKIFLCKDFEEKDEHFFKIQIVFLTSSSDISDSLLVFWKRQLLLRCPKSLQYRHCCFEEKSEEEFLVFWEFCNL